MPMGRLPFLGERLLGQLRTEAATAHDGSPGDVLSRLAVSRQLREVVSTAIGAPATPTYQAVYQHRTAAAPHRDKAGYDLVFHLTLAGDPVLEVFADDADADAEPQRIPLPPGHALVLRGQDVLHAWDPPAPDEQRTLIAVGFATAPS